jgi:hypothetical protein
VRLVKLSVAAFEELRMTLAGLGISVETGRVGTLFRIVATEDDAGEITVKVRVR